MGNMDSKSIKNPTKKLKMTIKADVINDAPELSIITWNLFLNKKLTLSL